MKGLSSLSSLSCFPFPEDGTGLQSAAEGAERVRGRERANNTLQRPQIFSAHNRGSFCSFHLALPDTETSLGLGDNECERLEGEDITGWVSGELPLHLGMHSLDFKPR